MLIQSWKGEKNRPLMVRRNCKCRTCQRAGKGKGVGFLSWSDHKGNGFTLWLKREEDYQALVKQLG